MLGSFADVTCYSSMVFMFKFTSAMCPFFYEGSAAITVPAFGSLIALFGLVIVLWVGEVVR